MNTIANGGSGNPLTLRLNIAANAGRSATAIDPTTMTSVQTPSSVMIVHGNDQTD